jgi:hypothetical protein
MNLTITGMVVLAALCAIATPDTALSQSCCTPGTSALGGTERGVVRRGELNASLSYDYYALARAYRGTALADDILHRTSTLQIVNISFEFGLADNISILLVANHSARRRELTATNATGSATETSTFEADGFGDMILLGKYQLITPTLFSPIDVGLGAGAKLPTGSYSLETRGARLSIDLQPGSGAPDLLGWLFGSWNAPAVRLRVFGSILYRYAGANPDGYKIGNEWLPSVGVGYSFVDWFDALIQLRGRIAGEDFAEGRFLPSTGGAMISIVPMILYREDNVAVRIYQQVPIYRNLNGTQLSLTSHFGIELNFTFVIQNGNG